MSQNIILKEDGTILGWREFVTPIKTNNAYRDGPLYLEDMRSLLGTYGITDTYAFSSDMLTMEMFVVLIQETAIILGSSAVATIFVVFLITGGPRLGLIIACSVMLTNFFLLAIIPLVSLQFNNVVVVYFITSIGLSVLYSA